MKEFNILQFEETIINMLVKETDSAFEITGSYPQEIQNVPIVIVECNELPVLFDFGENELLTQVMVDLTVWDNTKVQAIEIKEKLKRILLSKGFKCDVSSDIGRDTTSNKFYVDLSVYIFYNKITGSYTKK